MSYDVKYIGMDVHKEAIVIAVQNESGKLVMESVIETKASSILQFVHGLRGELHVTWEEGTRTGTPENLLIKWRGHAADSICQCIMKKRPPCRRSRGRGPMRRRLRCAALCRGFAPLRRR